ncbi:MAG: dihydropteroate synthase [Methylococcales bacterium]|nr:dihydropteroate synthase [Methylococcales bacterium]MCK5924992.1 dihydropteroate synthase [Methylococcales bacterium]
MFNLLEKPLIMGILNVTPDSFSDGGRYDHADKALEQAQKMILEGADIIDIGGESTRPNSISVSSGEQIARVIPIIKAIRQQLSESIQISIDTTLGTVAKAALEAGATMINDISGGRDPELLKATAKANCPIVLMHMQGTPQTMQDNPHYDEVIHEILSSLTHSVNQALAAGVKKENISIDPGIGFGKRKQDNFELLKHLDQFVATSFSVLLGTSRKRFMGDVCNVTEPSELIAATTATTALGVMAGVTIFRVHDVKENRQALEVAWAIKQAR